MADSASTTIIADGSGEISGFYLNTITPPLWVDLSNVYSQQGEISTQQLRQALQQYYQRLLEQAPQAAQSALQAVGSNGGQVHWSTTTEIETHNPQDVYQTLTPLVLRDLCITPFALSLSKCERCNVWIHSTSCFDKLNTNGEVVGYAEVSLMQNLQNLSEMDIPAQHALAERFFKAHQAAYQALTMSPMQYTAEGAQGFDIALKQADSVHQIHVDVSTYNVADPTQTQTLRQQIYDNYKATVQAHALEAQTYITQLVDHGVSNIVWHYLNGAQTANQQGAIIHL